LAVNGGVACGARDPAQSGWYAEAIGWRGPGAGASLRDDLFIHILEFAQHFIEFLDRSGSVRASVRGPCSAALKGWSSQVSAVIRSVVSSLSGKAGLATIMKGLDKRPEQRSFFSTPEESR
jgi:hypothetical protein